MNSTYQNYEFVNNKILVDSCMLREVVSLLSINHNLKQRVPSRHSYQRNNRNINKHPSNGAERIHCLSLKAPGIHPDTVRKGGIPRWTRHTVRGPRLPLRTVTSRCAITSCCFEPPRSQGLSGHARAFVTVSSRNPYSHIN